jgi:hypothetical protein
VKIIHFGSAYYRVFLCWLDLAVGLARLSRVHNGRKYERHEILWHTPLVMQKSLEEPEEIEFQ